MDFEKFKSVLSECVNEPEKIVDNVENILGYVEGLNRDIETHTSNYDELKSKYDSVSEKNRELLQRQLFSIEANMEVNEIPVEKTSEDI